MEYREPTMGDVQKVIKFQNDQLAKILEGKKFEKNKQIEEVISDIIMNDPNIMSDFLTQQRMQEPLITIMLCTGFSIEKALKADVKIYKECLDFLGRSGSDFLGKLGIDIRITQ